MIEKEPFTRYKLDEEKEKEDFKIFTIRLNAIERAQLLEDMQIIQQAKEGTAIKQLWQIGRAVLHDKKTGAAIRAVLGNVMNNKRTNAQPPEIKIDANVTQNQEEM